MSGYHRVMASITSTSVELGRYSAPAREHGLHLQSARRSPGRAVASAAPAGGAITATAAAEASSCDSTRHQPCAAVRCHRRPEYNGGRQIVLNHCAQASAVVVDDVADSVDARGSFANDHVHGACPCRCAGSRHSACGSVWRRSGRCGAWTGGPVACRCRLDDADRLAVDSGDVPTVKHTTGTSVCGRSCDRRLRHGQCRRRR